MCKSLFPVVWIVASLILAGCGKSSYEMAPAHGTVTLDGVPLTEGKIMFAPIARGSSSDAGKVAVGRIQDDGRYTLTTYDDNDGAVVGEHWVTVFGPDSETALIKFGRFTVREKKAVLADKENRIDIQLTRQDIAGAVVQGD